MGRDPTASGYNERGNKLLMSNDIGTGFILDNPSDRFCIQCIYHIMVLFIVEMEKWQYDDARMNY